MNPEPTTPPTRRPTARARQALTISTAVYFLMNGAQLFETFAIIPAWAGDPPASVMQLLRGPDALDFQAFWIVAHTLHEITFLVAIAFCWRLPAVRNPLLALFAVHVAVRAWTLAYFAPTIIALQTAPLPAGPELTETVTQWQNLNYLRVAVFVAVSLGCIPLINRLADTAPARTPQRPVRSGSRPAR